MDLAALKEVYARCDPNEPLPAGDPRYVDLDEARDIKWVDVIERRLGLSASPRQVLVAAGRGAGKTTELLRLAERVAKRESVNLYPVYVAAEKASTGRLGVGPVMLLIAVIQECSKLLGDTFRTVQRAPHSVRGLLEWSAIGAPRGLEAPWGISAGDVPVRLRDQYQRDPGSVVTSAGEMLMRCQTAAVAAGYRGLLVIVDSLDKVPFVGDLGVFLTLFASVRLSSVCVVPLWMAERVDALVLPMPRVIDRDANEDAAGVEAMARALEGRMYCDDVLGRGSWERSKLLARASGGSFSELLQFVRTLLQTGDLPAREADLTGAIARSGAALARWSRGEVGVWLRRVARLHALPPGDPREEVKVALREANLVYAYSDHGQLWFDVHPALRAELSRAEDEGSRSTSAGVRVRGVEQHYVSALQITNVGPFRSLALSIRPGWTVLLGDNGCGKTSVIRAIALVLAGTDPRAAVAAQRQLRAGEASGTITVGTDHGDYVTSLTRARAEVRTSSTVDTLTQQGRWLTLAFPAMRGLSAKAISGPTAVSPPAPGAYDLLPLLEGSADARLDDTRQWIVNTALRAEGNEGEEIKQRHAQLLTRWFSLVRELMPGLYFEYDGVDRESWQVLVKTADGIVPIEQLSQGMVSTLGWIGTLLRRLYEAFPLSARPEEEPALVLIDEIDAHLHPSWQRRIVPLVRKHFPRVQVIATSHSPLIVSNLEADEVVVFARDIDGQIAPAGVHESLRGYRADQVLTSPAFGLETSRSEYAVDLLRTYAEALAATVDTDEQLAALAQLTARVQREIPSPPESVEERAELDKSLRAADATIREHLDAADPDEVEKLEAMLKARRGGRDAA